MSGKKRKYLGLKEEFYSLKAVVMGLKQSLESPPVKFLAAGHVDTVGGGLTQEISIPPVKKPMVALAKICKQGASPVTVVACTCGDGKITVTFSDDPSDDHKVSYLICYS